MCCYRVLESNFLKAIANQGLGTIERKPPYRASSVMVHSWAVIAQHTSRLTVLLLVRYVYLPHTI